MYGTDESKNKYTYIHTEIERQINKGKLMLKI